MRRGLDEERWGRTRGGVRPSFFGERMGRRRMIAPPVHGVIFASYYDFLSARFGGENARSLFAGEPVYLMSEAYDDERFFGLVKKTCEEMNVETDVLLHDLGVFTAQKTFARLYPAFFAVAGTARRFLLTIEERIHELVRATIPDASPPQLTVAALEEDGVRIEYTSPRQLCVLLEGLVKGTAEHYGERAAIEHPKCMRRGDPACLFDVRLSRA
jgi:Haem-NO-binding